MEDWAGVIRELVGSTPALFIGIFLAAMILLCLKDRINFPKDKLWILWTVFILSGSLLVSSGIVQGYKKYDEWKASKRQISRLNNLGPIEKKCLSHYLKNDRRSIYVDDRTVCDEGTILSLKGSQIVYLEDKAKSDGNSGAYYIIQDWAFRYLKEHSELVNKK